MLEVKNINFKYKAKDFRMEDISLEISEGYIHTIIGENGSGKTTLLKLLYGMLTPEKGEIKWNEKAVSLDMLADFHKEVAFVGGDWCIPPYTLDKNAEILSTLYPDFDMDLWNELLERSNLTDVRENAYSTFSKGQQVKAEIAFNLAKKPKLMLLDEPLANLDPVFKVDILEILQSAVAKDGLGVVMSTNLLDEVKDMTDFAGIMKEGRLEKWGDRFEVFG